MKKVFNFLLVLLSIFYSYSASAQKPYISITHNANNYNVVEGNSIQLRLALSGAIATQIVVNLTTSTGTAGTSDFTTLSTTVTIPAGQTVSPYFTVPTINDTTIEPDENFTVNTQTISGNTSNINQQRIITILDNDTPPSVTATAETSAREGGYNATVVYSLSNVYNNDVVINCVTATGTANAADFTAVNSNVIIPAGQTYVNKTVTITDDANVESDETFLLNGTVTSGNTTNTSLSSTIKIIDNDSLPTISFNGYQVIEGQTATAFVVLDRTYSSAVVINFATSAGTAGTNDFTTTNITQTIVAGALFAAVSIPTTDDTLDEPVEEFNVTATVTSGNTTNTSETTAISINDNDGLPDLRVYFANNSDNQAPVSGGTYEGDTFRFYVQISVPLSTNTVIQVATAPGTASNADFTPINTTVTIPAGETSGQIDVQTTLDNLIEGTENFTFTATITPGTTFNTTASAVADILDNYNIHTNSDIFTFVAGTGNNLSVIANDLLQGIPVVATDVSITLDANTIGATINVQGILAIPASTPQGYYYLRYTACEVANPGICDTSFINLVITSPLELTFTSTYFDANADGNTSVGDIMNIAFTFENIGNATITNIQPDTTYPSNLNYSGGSIGSLAAGTANSTTITGQIIITQNDINTGTTSFIPQFIGNYYSNEIKNVIDSSLVINTSDGIRLKTFVDSNNNGIQDGIEPGFRFGNFDYSVNGGVVHNIYSQSEYYIYESNPASLYNLSLNVDAPYATYNLCPTVYPNINVATGSGITNYTFPIATTPYQDTSAFVIALIPPRPGEVWNNHIVYRNYSNQPVASGSITFTKDSQISITNVSQAGATITPSGFTFNFSNLAPFETRYLNVELLVPSIPTVALNQLVTNSVAITMPVGDINPYNNTSSITNAIVGSYDPNDITEHHGEKIIHSTFTTDDYLTYTIRFENTGNAEAINIRIEEVLDAKIDASTIRMIDSSDDYILERIGSNLTWKFNGINLPPSVENTQIGHGYLTFQVKPNSGYAIGDIIPSEAAIYFDTNPPIITNTFNTEFVTTLSTSTFKAPTIRIYPNPASQSVQVALHNSDKGIATITLFDIVGKKVKTIPLSGVNTTTIDVSTLTKGIYLMSIEATDKSKIVKKLIIQ